MQPDVREYLERNLDIKIDRLTMGSSYRPLTASLNYDNLSVTHNKTKRLSNSRANSRNPFSTSLHRSTSVSMAGTQTRPQTSGVHGVAPASIVNPLSVRFQNLIHPPTSQRISETRIKSIVKKRIGNWMREQHLLPIDAFFTILAKELGENVVRTGKYDRDLFARCLILLDIGIDEKSAQQYVGDLADVEGKIDASGFERHISDEDRDDLNHIRDIIHLNGLKFEDILKTMDIPRENAELNIFTISKGICRIDPKMPKNRADQIAFKILNNREQINIYDLVESLEGINKGRIQLLVRRPTG